ncbi:hypothetical protein B9Z65_3501 [Elsinoe australis]|uniref:Proline racemase n=1 Tax=Elsinoe australis TaxID=40998 RepID=A0A2P8AFD6_9PEZI|nr:hypothetical protein B9Z65_3501 [Elsinoe australis]
MRFTHSLTVVGCHAEGEVGDVITGGVLDVPGNTMYEKVQHFQTRKDEVRQLLLNEPRGRSSINTNLLLPPCNPEADAGFLIMESEEYAPMSGSNTICTATVLLETGMLPVVEPVTNLKLDTAAGLVPGFGSVLVDIAWGGMWYVLVDAAPLRLKVDNDHGPKLVEIGERVKRAVQAQYTPVHPENANIKGVTILAITEPLEDGQNCKIAKNTVVVSPGRFDRSPCGTGTCARMAALYARGLLKEGEIFRHRSIIDTEFVCHIRGTTKIGGMDAILPTVKGRAWITSFKQVVLDPTDPFPTGFRVGDQWHNSVNPDEK